MKKLVILLTILLLLFTYVSIGVAQPTGSPSGAIGLQIVSEAAIADSLDVYLSVTRDTLYINIVYGNFTTTGRFTGSSAALDSLFFDITNKDIWVRRVDSSTLAFENSGNNLVIGLPHEIHLDHDASSLSDGQTEVVYDAVINNFGATGGELHALHVSVTDENAAGNYIAVGTLSGVSPIHQHVGSPTTATKVLKVISSSDTTDVTTATESTSADSTLFENDDDELLIGDSAVFGQLFFQANTVASGGGISPTFWYSLTNGTWTEFFPEDDTKGFRQHGIISWDETAFTSWATYDRDGSTVYWIKIIRTRSTLTTSPIEDTIQILAATEYIWDKNGDLTINNIQATAIDNTPIGASTALTGAFTTLTYNSGVSVEFAQESYALAKEIDAILSDALCIYVWATPLATEVDQSGEGHTATYVNMDADDWVRHGSVWSLHKEIDEYATAADHADFSFLSGSDDAAVSFGGRALFYSDTNVKTLMAKYDESNSQKEWMIQCNTDERLYIVFYDEDKSLAAEGRISDQPIPDGYHDWYIIYDGTQGTSASDGMTMYIDGQEIASSVSDVAGGGYVDKEDLGQMISYGTRLDNDTSGDSWISEMSYMWIEQSKLSAAAIRNLYKATSRYVDIDKGIILPASGVLTNLEYYPVRTRLMIAGYTTAFGDLVYLNNDDSRLEKTDADAAVTAANVMVGIALEIAADGKPCLVMLEGQITIDSWNWGTVGASLWISEIAGEFEETVSNIADVNDTIRPVADVIDDDTIYFHGEAFYTTVP